MVILFYRVLRRRCLRVVFELREAFLTQAKGVGLDQQR